MFCSIPSRSLLSPSYYHSFGLTENYVIFLEQPFKLDILKMATAYMRGVSWASCMSFHREDKVRPSCRSTPLEGSLLGTLTALACLCRQLPPSGEFRCWDGFIHPEFINPYFQMQISWEQDVILGKQPTPKSSPDGRYGIKSFSTARAYTASIIHWKGPFSTSPLLSSYIGGPSESRISVILNIRITLGSTDVE